MLKKIVSVASNIGAKVSNFPPLSNCGASLLNNFLSCLISSNVNGCSSSDLAFGVNFLYKLIIGLVPNGSIKIIFPSLFTKRSTSFMIGTN